MKINVTMPKLGESLTEGTILKWLKNIGDSVEKDETLLEVSTDKVDSEIPSPEAGILVEILAEENQTVGIDTVIGVLESGAVVESDTDDSEEKPTESEGKPAAQDSGTNLVDVTMPKLGESLTEGTILKWWKKVGESIEKDETLLEVSTDKVDSEISSPVGGIVVEIMAEENQTVEIDSIIARIQSGYAPAAGVKKIAEKPAEEKQAAAVQPLTESAQTPSEINFEKTNKFYSPLVKTIARTENLTISELENIAGSGAGGRVTKNDVLNYLKHRTAATVQKAAPPPQQDLLQFKGSDRELLIPMDNIRKKIARHMRDSLDTSAHVYSVSECDMTNVLQTMKALRPQYQQTDGFKLTITPFILNAVAKAIMDFPRINSSVNGEQIIEKHYINLGLAVASERGLIVPVVKGVEEKNFRGLSRSLHDIIQRTRENKLTIDDVQGATFTITNYGVFGNVIGLPIINQPNVAILGLGAIKKKPVVIESEMGDSIAIRSMTYISMSYDHRIIDGELGGRFMQRVVEYLENTAVDNL